MYGRRVDNNEHMVGARIDFMSSGNTNLKNQWYDLGETYSKELKIDCSGSNWFLDSHINQFCIDRMLYEPILGNLSSKRQ